MNWGGSDISARSAAFSIPGRKAANWCWRQWSSSKPDSKHSRCFSLENNSTAKLWDGHYFGYYLTTITWQNKWWMSYTGRVQFTFTPNFVLQLSSSGWFLLFLFPASADRLASGCWLCGELRWHERGHDPRLVTALNHRLQCYSVQMIAFNQDYCLAMAGHQFTKD